MSKSIQNIAIVDIERTYYHPLEIGIKIANTTNFKFHFAFPYLNKIR